MLSSNPICPVCNYATSAVYCDLPSPEQLVNGVKPLDSLPAAWWNKMWNMVNCSVNQARGAVGSFITELNNVLAGAGICPNCVCTDQLYQAIDLIRQTIGNATVAGAVKSSATPGMVSIDNSGFMTANCVGNATQLATTARTLVGAVNELKTTYDTCFGNVSTTLSGKAPTSHASSATTYGVGTSANYGHVKLSDSTTSPLSASDGVAATPKAVCGLQKTLNEWVDTSTTSIAGKAPTSHASSATTYGVGTSANYGHVKLSDSTTSPFSASDGVAATPKAICDLQKALNEWVDTSTTSIAGKAPTSHASSATTYGVGTSANYGHLRISSTYTSNLKDTGMAASQTALYNVYNYATQISKAAIGLGDTAGCPLGTAAAGTAGTAARSDHVHPLQSCLPSTGFGFCSFTYYQTYKSFAGSTGDWAHYLISNHMNGSSYFNFIIREPFWAPPQYSRMNDGYQSPWYAFITSENIGSQSVACASCNGSGVAFGSAATKTAGSAAGNVPLIGTALGTIANKIVLTDASGQLVPSSSAVGSAAYCAATAFRSCTWVPTASDVGAAPTSHASSATTYGVGTSANYGHVKLSDSTTSPFSASDGVAATPKAICDLQKALNEWVDTSTTSIDGLQKTLNEWVDIFSTCFDNMAAVCTFGSVTATKNPTMRTWSVYSLPVEHVIECDLYKAIYWATGNFYSGAFKPVLGHLGCDTMNFVRQQHDGAWVNYTKETGAVCCLYLCCVGTSWYPVPAAFGGFY